jgi:hypothetical protein
VSPTFSSPSRRISKKTERIYRAADKPSYVELPVLAEH